MFIADFRESLGLELNEFARAVNIYRRAKLNQTDPDAPLCGLLGTQLVHMLEVDKNCVTHPDLAAAICTICGATPEQYDSIVAKFRRGKWQLDPNDAELVMDAISQVREPKDVDDAPPLDEYRTSPNAKAVVKIDFFGNTLARYVSTIQAANTNGIDKGTVRRACLRVRNKIPSPMLKTFTFRYATEWDTMTGVEKMKDARNH